MQMGKAKRSLKPRIRTFICVAAAAVILAVCFVILRFAAPGKRDNSGGNNASRHTSTAVTSSKKLYEPVSVTLGATGDLLIHDPILNAYKAGNYDFTDIFKYAGSYFQKYDYMVANLEVTLGGAERGYTGYPIFNAPDSLIDAATQSGIDLFLTANNHCYDTGKAGFDRTVAVLRQKQVDHTGTRAADEQPYLLKQIKGITFGLLNYTYETAESTVNGVTYKTINGIRLNPDSEPLVNSFNYNKLDEFYAEAGERISEMRNRGAEVIIMYIHWGNEYQIQQNNIQQTIAKKLSDLGVDVIIGGHPHVVQPVEIINSEVTGRQTVCLYSLGNAVSNQRTNLMDLKTGHTEDGMIFETSFNRDSDGNVTLEKINVIPTWVYLKTDSSRHYYILPLDNGADWESAYGINAATKSLLQKSYDRTMALVQNGLSDFNTGYRKFPLNKADGTDSEPR